jgi:hypothetical protein
MGTTMAEGMVSEPFLPSGDQDHKGGFAPLPKPHPIACRITNKTPHKDKPFPSSLGRKNWSEHRNFEELGTRSHETQQGILETNPIDRFYTSFAAVTTSKSTLNISKCLRPQRKSQQIKERQPLILMSS